ncbi:MAG: nuclease [Deltaproteobacteria bacterium]|nr:MAG: nuclease [Deltaproteobacteria bacterium]
MYRYKAKVVRVVDGDTLDLAVSLGFKINIGIRARLYGVDTPETYGVKHDSDEYAKGLAAKQFVESWLVDHGHDVLIVSHDGKKLGKGKYGRWIAEIFPNESTWAGDHPSLNEALVTNGHAERVSY